MTGGREMERALEPWQIGVKALRRRMIRAPTLRERERWYAIRLLAQDMTAAATAVAGAGSPHQRALGVGLRSGRPHTLIFEQSGGSPRPRP